MLTEHQADLRTEIVAGVTTFLTMAYIVVVNPAILSTEGTGMPFSGVMTATVMIGFVMTLVMGLYARLPYAVAPGMGLNAFFTYTIVLGQGVPWPVALGMVFWAGVIFVVISLTPLREAIARAIPTGLRGATAVGIGMLLTFIGLQNAGFVAASPVTFVTVGPIGWEGLLTLLGVALAAWLVHKGRSVAYLAAIAVVAFVAWSVGLVERPVTLLSMPDFQSVWFRVDIPGALQFSLVPAIIALLFTDLFDSLATFIGVSHAAGLVDREGQPLRLRQGLIVDAFATLGSGLAGSSPGTTYIESVSGISMGGRTGRTSIITALCFLPCLFLGPLAAAVPPYATAAVLILVGASMFRTVAHIPLARIEDAVPAFVTMLLIPLTFSITQGILWGFILHAGLYTLTGRRRDVHPMMFVLALLSIGLLILEHGA
jgi:adenine/guanine/hypoxanthine permease